VRLRAFHLHKARYADQAFSGQGARLAGGRWNRPGAPMVYCAESLALATIEILVNLEDRRLLAGYHYAPVAFDERLVEVLAPRRLPNDWRAIPVSEATRALGGEWLEQRRSVVLKVPSVVVPSEFNYLLNPLHPLFADIEIGRSRPYPTDPRLGSK